MSTIEQTATEYIALSPAQRAAEMAHALTEAQRALHAAQQRLASHTAQRPARAADVAAWARHKAALTAEIEGYEGLVSDAAAQAQQAQAEAKQQQRAEWYAERDRLADLLDATFGPRVVAVNEALRAALAEISQIGQDRDAWIADEWTPHAHAAQQLGEIPTHEFQIVRVGGHGEISVPPLFVPRSGRRPPLRY